MLPSVFQSKNARSRGQITNSNESVLIQIQISATMLINSTRIGATLSWPSSLSSNRWRSSWLAPNPAKKLLNLTYDSNDSARLSLRFSWASVIQKKWAHALPSCSAAVKKISLSSHSNSWWRLAQCSCGHDIILYCGSLASDEWGHSSKQIKNKATKMPIYCYGY